MNFSAVNNKGGSVSLIARFHLADKVLGFLNNTQVRPLVTV